MVKKSENKLLDAFSIEGFATKSMCSSLAYITPYRQVSLSCSYCVMLLTNKGPNM